MMSPRIAFVLALVAASLCVIQAADSSCTDDDKCTAPTIDLSFHPIHSLTMSRIHSRGYLICAHCDDTLGHSKVVNSNEASGFEPEICKGLAAAIGVKPSFYLMKTPAERFPLLQSNQIDIALSLTSKTIQRDMMERGSFSQYYRTRSQGIYLCIPYFQDQHNVMVRSDAGINSGADLQGKSICVTAGTTNPNVFGDYLASIESELGPDGVKSVTIVTVADDTTALAKMASNECHGFVNDDSVVAGYVHSIPAPEGIKYILASWKGTPFARAPFSALTLDGDNDWASIVDWYINGLFLAEMYGVTQENVDQKAVDRALPGEAQRLLGSQLIGGKKLQFDMKKAIKAIGNYAEVYERNFGAFLPRSRANTLYQNGGAIFPGGFR